jgi:hypothetical protein
LARFQGNGWSFDYPASWARYEAVQEGSHANAFGFLTDEELDEARACDDTDGTVRCQIGPRSGHPGGVLVEISATVCAWGCIRTWRASDDGFLRIDGIPATTSRGSDANWEYWSWSLADPSNASQTLWVRAMIRRPTVEASNADVEGLMASWRWDPPFVPLDPADAPSIAAKTVRDAKLADPTYACVPERAGFEQRTKLNTIDENQLRRPIEVTCSVSIRATSGIYWLVRMEVAWQAQGGSKAGAEVREVWLTRDGVATWGSARHARPPYCCVADVSTIN